MKDEEQCWKKRQVVRLKIGLVIAAGATEAQIEDVQCWMALNPTV